MLRDNVVGGGGGGFFLFWFGILAHDGGSDLPRFGHVFGVKLFSATRKGIE